LRGLSASSTAILTATIRAAIVLFGWCVSDSVFTFLLSHDTDTKTSSLFNRIFKLALLCITSETL
jgi:hypothetical protein